MGTTQSMRDLLNAYKSLVGKLRGRDHLEDISIVGRIILEWILSETE
jgi:hypothetical protein